MRVLLWLFCLAHLATHPARAGDAVAVAYNAEGAWTMVTYYCSSTAKGGADYKNEAAAREAAVRDLKQREGENLARTSVIASSDRTAHVAYARGKTAAGKDVHAVGYGESSAQAENEAFARLQREGATVKPTVIYRYFTHGAETAGDARQP